MNLRLLLLGSLTLLVTLCGCESSTSYSVHAPRYSVELPDSWRLAPERMSRISEPRELFSAGTARLTWRPTNCEAFAGAAGASMGAADVVLTVWERRHVRQATGLDFPARPAAFGPVGSGEAAGSGCREPRGTVTHWRNFSDAERHFHTLVRIGPDAPPESVEDAWHVLDSVRLGRERKRQG
jgi:hypothetical protein